MQPSTAWENQVVKIFVAQCTVHVPQDEPLGCTQCTAHTDEKERKKFPHIRKFRMEQLQSNIWLTASSYMRKYLRISSYMTFQLLHSEFLYIRGNLIFFFISAWSTATSSSWVYTLSCCTGTVLVFLELKWGAVPGPVRKWYTRSPLSILQLSWRWSSLCYALA